MLAMAEGLREARRAAEARGGLSAAAERPARGILTMLPASWERNRGRTRSRPQRRPAGRRVCSGLALIVFGASSSSSSSSSRSPRASARPASPPATSPSSRACPTKSATSAKPKCKRSIARQETGAKLKKAAEAGQQKSRRTEGSGDGRTARSDLDPRRGRRTGITVTDKEVETELAKIKKANFPTPAAYKEFLKELELDPGRSQQAGRTAGLQQKDPGKGRQAEAPTPSNSEIAEYYEAEQGRPSSRPNRAATSA